MSVYPKALKRNKTVLNRETGYRCILGIDPGLASTGWGLVEFLKGKIRYIDHGCIHTQANCPRTERLFFIMDSFRKILNQYSPTEAAIETLYFSRNVSSAIPVAEARGVVSAILGEAGLPVYELTPNAIKQGVCGVVRADKLQMQSMVKIILGLSEIPEPDHAADALAAAICVANQGVIA